MPVVTAMITSTGTPELVAMRSWVWTGLGASADRDIKGAGPGRSALDSWGWLGPMWGTI